MFYVIAGSLITVFVILSLVNSSRKRQRKIIEEIRTSWGKTKTGSFPYESIKKYATVSSANGFHRLNKQTTTDIDFLELFSFIDRTNSKIGQQYLFNQLLHPSNDQNALHTFNQRVQLLANDQALRESSQKELIRLSGSDAYLISSLLEKKLLEAPSWLPFLYFNVLIMIALVILSFIYPVAFVFIPIPATINMLVHYWNKGNTLLFARSFPQLSLMIDVCEKISQKNLHYDLEGVRESITVLKPLQWKMGFLNLSAGGSIKDELGQVATYLVELLKAFFMIEVFMLFKLTKELESRKDSIQTLFDYVGSLDSALSVASLRAGDLKTCIPEFTPPMRELIITGMYHPLIKNCIKNSLHLRDKSILITGSNMSGKTTFLRTIAINSILAQTICTCFADEFQTPMLRQFSSIRIDDSLLEGKSYYYEEVNTIGGFIKEVNSPFQNLFMLDEVFKGTNTIERIAAAKAALSYLNHGPNLVIVSTHDLELPAMLQQHFDLYHFSESIIDKKLHFDHKIKTGPLLAGNAIKILEMSNYPEQIINEAREVSAALSAT